MPPGGGETVLGMGLEISHSSMFTTGQTINLAPLGRGNGSRSTIAEKESRSLGRMARSSAELAVVEDEWFMAVIFKSTVGWWLRMDCERIGNERSGDNFFVEDSDDNRY